MWNNNMWAEIQAKKLQIKNPKWKIIVAKLFGQHRWKCFRKQPRWKLFLPLSRFHGQQSNSSIDRFIGFLCILTIDSNNRSQETLVQLHSKIDPFKNTLVCRHTLGYNRRVNLIPKVSLQTVTKEKLNTQPTRHFPFSQNSYPFREVTVDFSRVLYMFLFYFSFCLHIEI